MKSIKITKIKNKVAELIKEASFNLPPDIKEAIKCAREKESGKASMQVLDLILENSLVAPGERLPLCQDCGNTYIDLKIGPGIYIEDSGNISRHLNDAVAKAYKDNFLRMSIVNDPLFERINTGDNTPALVSMQFVNEPGLKISVSLKGGGSENCSYLSMENPSIGQNEIIGLVLGLVRANITKCCPPAIIGIGIGSTASEVAKLARTAAFRDLNIRNSNKKYRALEEIILEEVNNTGIGPQGLGGKTTAIGCNIEYGPCHIATLPVSVFLQCHSLRRASSKILPQ